MKEMKTYESEVDFAKDLVLEEMEDLIKEIKTYSEVPMYVEGKRAAFYEITQSLLEDKPCSWFWKLRDKEEALKRFCKATKSMIDFAAGMLWAYSRMRRNVEKFLEGDVSGKEAGRT